MALLAYSGMDFEYPFSSSINKGMWASVSGNMQFRNNNGRYGKGGAQGWSNNYSALLFDTADDTIIVGVATRIRETGTSNAAAFKFLDGTTAIVTLVFNGLSAGITLHRGSFSTVIASTSGISLSLNTYHWFTFKIKFHETLGSIDVSINNEPVWSATGLNTLNGLTVPDRLGLLHNSSGGYTPDWDDLIICDSTGAAPFNDLLDDMQIVSVFPNSDVSIDPAWVPSTGTTHYTCIDEQSGLVTSDYLECDTFGKVDRFGFTTTTLEGDIIAGRIIASGQADVAHIMSFTMHGPSNYNTELSWAGDNSNYMWSKVFDLSADGWTLSDIDALEISMELPV